MNVSSILLIVILTLSLTSICIHALPTKSSRAKANLYPGATLIHSETKSSFKGLEHLPAVISAVLPELEPEPEQEPEQELGTETIEKTGTAWNEVRRQTKSQNVSTVITGSASVFNVSYFNIPDDNFKAAADFAIQQVAGKFHSSVTIDTKVMFYANNPNNYLAYGSAAQYILLDDGVYYQVAAAESILGSHQNIPTTDPNWDYDLLILVYLGTINWYTNPYGSPDLDQFDFVTVMMHETLHALFFTGMIKVESGPKWGGWDGPKASFDLYLSSYSGCAIYGYATNMNDTKNGDIGKSVTNTNLFFSSRGNKRIVELYAPAAFTSASSVYHYDQDQFTDLFGGDEDSLMKPALNSGFKNHDFGDYATEIMQLILAKSSDPPEPCEPGTYDANQPTENNQIAGMEPWAFYLVIGISAFVGVVLFTLLIACCAMRCGASPKKHHRKQPS